MYHKRINIIIISQSVLIQDFLGNELIKNGYFEYEIKTLKNIQDFCLDCDILVCDQPVSRLQIFRENMKKHAYILYICDGNEEVCEDLYTVADEVVAHPDMRYVGRRIIFLYECLKQKEANWLLETYLDTLMDSMPDLVWFKDNRGAHVKVNKVFCHTVGKTREEIEGKGHCAIWNVDVDDCAETEDIVRQRKETCQFYELVKSMQGLRQFRTYKSPLFDPHKQIMGTVGIGHDITDLENMSVEIEILLNSMPYAIILKDQDGVILEANDKFVEYFKRQKEEVIGTVYDVWYSSLFESQTCKEEISNGRTFIFCNTTDRVMEITYEKIYDIFNNDVGALYIYRDTTEEYLFEQQLSNNSNTDYLTGLFNRRYFYMQFSNMQKFEQISLLYVDLDQFKSVNDTYGHQIGDEALKLSAQVLKKMFPDDLIARLGGDEFLISKTGPFSEEELMKLGNDLIYELKKNFAQSTFYHNLSASIGISYSTDQEIKIDELIKESDTALYQSKHSGRSKCCILHKKRGENL